MPRVIAREGMGFLLKLQLASDLTAQQQNEIEAALRWWSSFGGVGARNRRGLGALLVIGLEPINEKEVLEKGGRLALLSSVNNPTHAWQTAIAKLKGFRQGFGAGRNPPAPESASPAGRSLWPEAETLRSLSGQTCPKHAGRLVLSDGFPRAAFGLPIVFHFKDTPSEKDQKSPGYSRNNFDPEDHILEPEDISPTNKRDRMASPLILRPYWNGTQWQAAALLLPGWEKALDQPLKFKGQNYAPAHWPADSKSRQEKARHIQPMMKGGALRADDPLSAFMHYFEKG